MRAAKTDLAVVDQDNKFQALEGCHAFKPEPVIGLPGFGVGLVIRRGQDGDFRVEPVVWVGGVSVEGQLGVLLG